MAIFSMGIGAPYSGKTTWCKEHWNYEVVSSDAIREELYGDESLQIDHTRVFKIAHERILNLLAENKDVFFDATNLVYKYRKPLLDKVRKCPNTLITAEIFVEPFGVLVERSKHRDRYVPEEVVQRMLRQFEMPTYAEGFDYINIHNTTRISATRLLEQAKSFNQDNPHHTNTLYEHCAKAAEYLSGKPVMYAELRAAALYHDLGKLFTKTYVNARGEDSPYAHYYGHENIGAYYALAFEELHNTCLDIVEIAQLINYHMLPYSENTEKAKARRIARLGNDLYDKVMLIHEADKKAH